jgi:hypothetical protein
MLGFFLSITSGIYKQYSVLFGTDKEESGQDNDFNKRWGWFRSSKLVADFENISVTEVYDLGVYYFLNILAYLKDYNKEKEREYKEWQVQHQQTR